MLAVTVRYYDIDKENANKVNLLSNGNFSSLSNIPVGTLNANFLLDNYDPPNYLSFDGNGIDLKEKDKKFYSSGDYVGCISASASDGSKQINGCGLKFVAKNDGVLKLNKSITITFYGNCCNKMYAMYRNEDGEAFSEEEISVGKEIFILNTPAEFSSLELYFTETVLPNQLIKISDVKIGDVTVLDKFQSVGLLEELSVLSDDLPINALNFTLTTKNGSKLKNGNPITVYSNQKRYYGTFWITDIKRVGEYSYDITTQNAINKLEKTNLDKWKIDTDFNVALAWLKEISGVNFETEFECKTITMLLGETYPFDVSKLFFKGYIGVGTCRKALCAMGFALGFMVDGSRSAKITLKPIPTKITSVITTADRRIIGNAVLTKKDLIKTAKLHTVTSFLEKVAEEVTYEKGGKYYTGNLPMVRKPTIVSGTADIEWSACYVKFSSDSGATLKIYPAELCKDVYYLENTNTTDGESNEADFTTFDLSGYYLLSDGSNGTPYVTDAVTRKNDFLKYIQSRGTVSAKIRLKNEKVGDLIQIETAWDGVITGIITSMNISFGYEDIADIEVLEWQSGQI